MLLFFFLEVIKIILIYNRSLFTNLKQRHEDLCISKYFRQKNSLKRSKRGKCLNVYQEIFYFVLY